MNFNYRLAPEHPFPASLEDINAVFSWIKENGKDHHIDTEHLFAVGDSAGAQMLSQFAAMLTNRDFARLFEDRYGFRFPELKLSAVALNCGRYEMTAPDDEGCRKGMFGRKPVIKIHNRKTTRGKTA